MRPSVLAASLVAAAAACTPRAVTPPTRTFALDSPNAPAVGHSDVQMGAARIGTIWGPELVNADTRVRHAVRRGVVVEGEAGLLHLLNEGGGDNRNAVTARIGVLLRPPEYETQELRVALSLGAGGGHSPAAGDWGTFDAGVLISGSHRWVRPVVGLGGGVSRPFGDTTFTVTEPDGDPTMLQLPRNLTGYYTAGIELGPPHRTVILGGSVTHFWLQEPSVLAPAPAAEDADDVDIFFAVGAAARFSLD